MLVLSREVGESVVIAEGTPYETKITVVRSVGGRVRLGFQADRSVAITRPDAKVGTDSIH